jgi:hypothetical protein
VQGVFGVMGEEGASARSLTIPEAAELRGKTEAISQLLRSQIESHLETLRTLFAPRRLLGKHLGGSASRDEVPGADKALIELERRYKEAAGPPFVLRPQLDHAALANLQNRIELYPWEYAYQASSGTETKTIDITSPVRWVMSYASHYSLSQLRQVLAEKEEKRADDVRQFVVNALVMRAMLDKFPSLTALLADLRFEIGIETADGLGKLPLVTLNSNLSSFRPPDDLILTTTGFSGVAAFIELVDEDAVQNLRDPLREKIKGIMS